MQEHSTQSTVRCVVLIIVTQQCLQVGRTLMEYLVFFHPYNSLCFLGTSFMFALISTELYAFGYHEVSNCKQTQCPVI